MYALVCCECLEQALLQRSRRDMKDTQQLTEIRAGVLSCLDGLPGVVNVRSSNAGPSSPAAISAWERKHATLLPDDLKDFYLLWDGLALRWDVIAHRREIVPLGCMAINSLAQLEPVDAAVLLDEREESRPELPKAGPGGLRPFNLDATCECGRILLLLGCDGMPRRAEVWFQDVSCGLTRLAPSFAEYFRLLAVSLGLPRWPYAHTDAGLDPTARQWFRLLAPHHLAVSEDNERSATATAASAPSPAASLLAAAWPPRGGATKGLGLAAPLTHSQALALLQRAGGAAAQTATPVAAGAPREAVALLHGSRPAAPFGASDAPAGGRPRPTGEAGGVRRHRTLRAAAKATGLSSKMNESRAVAHEE